MVFCPTSEQINEAVKEIDSLGAPASGSSRSSSGSSTTGTTGAQTGGGVGQPEPDAVDPAKVLAWQQYLANDGLLNLNNPNSIDNKSNASPEATGGGTGPLTGIAGQSKNDLLGQPAGPDDEQSGGGGGTNPDDRRAWATNPGPDGSSSDGGRQIEEDPADIDTTPNGHLGDLIDGGSSDEDDTQSATRRYYAGRLTSTTGSDDDDD